jgi:hypothetical protein
MKDDLDLPANADELAAAERLARALQTGLAGAPSEDEAFAVARLLDGLRERPSDELRAARTRRELVARAALHARARRAAVVSLAALAAGLLVATGLFFARRPASPDANALADRERAARAALARLGDSRREEIAGASLASRLESSRFDALLSRLDEARVERLRWSEGSSSESSAARTPAVRTGGVS